MQNAILTRQLEIPLLLQVLSEPTGDRQSYDVSSALSFITVEGIYILQYVRNTRI